MAWGRWSLDFSGRTLVMGILNVTPDSFSDGGKFSDVEAAVRHGLAMGGADILDIGGESTRPGSAAVSAEEQIRRVVPVIEKLAGKVTIPISIDTTSAAVAKAALDAGAAIINDISGLRFDSGMAKLAVDRGVPVIIMHMQGLPGTMQESPSYEDVVGEVKDFLRGQVDFAVSEGVAREKIIVDVGIGFGKRLEDNLSLLSRVEEFYELGLPVLVGHSRKSFLGMITGEPAEKRDEATLAVSMFLATKGVHVLRVHEVGSTRRGCEIVEKVRKV
jgi:dihydropteroate synthase